MDSKDGGQVSADPTRQASNMQRQTAANLARKKVLAAYANAAQNEADEVSSQAVKGTHLKDQPAAAQVTTESWKKYHSAWQDYYQKYYSEYYANAARNYVEKERLKDARRQAEEADLPVMGTQVVSQEEEVDNIGARLKQTIRKKATENVKQTRRRRRWIPFAIGAVVVLLVLFLQYNRLIFAPIFAYVSPGNAPATEIEAIDPMITQTVSADPRLIIPKLNIDVPIHFGLQLSEVMGAMNSGVAHYRIAGASAYPGEVGNTVITGHSAGDIYSANPYKYIFSGLERLEDGDLIYINYNSVRYTYRVVKKEVVEPTDVAALVIETDVPMLTLVTCTPLGTSRYRLLVEAEQISPGYDEADTVDEPSEVAPQHQDDSALPSNEPSFFEGIWGFLTGGA